MNKPQITKCTAREILDSRGYPTVEATVFLSDGTVGVASVPSGASTGIYEAHEKRDNDIHRYNGKGVMDAVYSICKIISPAICGISASEQYELDKILIQLDGTENKSKIGANALLAVSLATARAAANWYHIPLYRYLGGIHSNRLPIPMMNILNGGAHASNNVEIQEFMIVPYGITSFSEAIRAGCEVYHSLGKLLRTKGLTSTVGDEGGFAPDLVDDEQAIEFICEAIKSAGYSTNEIKIALDAASSEWYVKENEYVMPKTGKYHRKEDLIKYWNELVTKYPIMSIEDALDQRDFEGWGELTSKIGDRVMLVGDDFFVTNAKRLSQGISMKAANSILIKPNQIGTLSETLNVIHTAQKSNYNYILSHRSGETEDTTIADIAVAFNSPYIKTGAPCRSERVAKYNRLLRIEGSLNSSGVYGFN